jgi:hypothetical protein
MGMIRIYEKAGKTKRQPGWKQREAEYAAWLKGVQAMSSGIKPRSSKLVLNKKIKVETPQEREERRARYVVGGAGKPVPRPEILYRDDPEMLARELKARERKFNVAPAYNKGNDILMTDDMMEDLKKGLLRRR